MKFYLTAFVLCVFVSCTDSSKSEINEIKIAEGMDHISPLKLSAVSSNLEYIPLETTT